MTSPQLQGRSGMSRSLRALAKQLLGLDIQAPGRRHDAEEDARAVMQLYCQHAEQGSITEYEDLVAYYTRQALAKVQAKAAEEEQEQEQEEEEEV
jgi:DNA polymerase III epsilon subunit-like protein